MTMHEAPNPDQHPGRRAPSPLGRRWLIPGALVMAAAAIATGAALLIRSAGIRGAESGFLERLFDALRSDAGMDVYLLAVAFIVVSSLLLVTSADRVAPLVFAIMSIAVLLILPLTVLALDIPPFGFDERLVSGSLRQLIIIIGPLVALAGWFVALMGYGRARRRS